MTTPRAVTSPAAVLDHIGDGIRITARLIKVADGYQLWAEARAEITDDPYDGREQGRPGSVP